MRMRLALTAVAFGGALMCASAAVAQYGGQYDAPRPPGSVPVRPPSQQPPPPQYYYPPPSRYAPPPGAAPPPPRTDTIQGEDLPAPGSAPPAGPEQNPDRLQQRPGQQPPPATTAAVPPPQSPPAAAPPASPPPAEVVTEPPAARISNPTAVFNGLDKITGRITSFESAIGETVQFGALQVTVRACYTRPPTEAPLTDGFVEVDEVTLQGDIRRIFTGWMFAASPGLHAVEHAIYDVWLVGCKGGAQAAANPPPAAAPPPRQPPSRQSPPRTRPPQRQPPPQFGPGR